MAYIGKSPTSNGVRSRYYFTASGSETSLSGADDNSRTLTFSDGNYVDVSLNGVALVAGTDYNTSTANTISGLSALAASDVVEVIVYDVFSVADTVSAADGGVFSGAVVFNAGISNLIRIQTFTSNGTYTPSTGATKALMYCTGGGGGAGSVDGQGSGTAAASTGGSGGGTAVALVTSLAASYTVTVGAGGNGGASGNNDGNDGNDSTVTDGASFTLTGAGGNAGTGQLASSGNNIAEGVAGGSASGGDFIIHGGDSSAAVIITGEIASLSVSGGSFYDPSGVRCNHNGNGHNAFSTAYGCGGGACSNLDTNFNRAGGDGADGVVIIYEYL